MSLDDKLISLNDGIDALEEKITALEERVFKGKYEHQGTGVIGAMVQIEPSLTEQIEEIRKIFRSDLDIVIKEQSEDRQRIKVLESAFIEYLKMEGSPFHDTAKWKLLKEKFGVDMDD